MKQPFSLDRQIGSILQDLDSWSNEDDGTFYHAPTAELANPYLREEFIVNSCKNKSVLHFGFADSPFTKERYGTKQMLHSRIREVARDVWGADIDKEGVEIYRELSGDKQSWIMDICDPNLDVKKYTKNFDVIIFGEILEHLLNPGDALRNLLKISRSNSAKLVITTPNALNAAGFVAATKGREIVHPEHYYYYSPVTLERLLHDCGLTKLKFHFTQETTPQTSQA